jgi:hypothetical protein
MRIDKSAAFMIEQERMKQIKGNAFALMSRNCFATPEQLPNKVL